MSLQAACPHSETPGGDHLPTEAARAESFREDGSEARTGVLLVNHGSRSPNWRQMLFDLHAEVAPGLLAIPGIAQVRTAFMEYTEPSIATQLRAFDESGVETVLVVPMLLTISDHSFDDIPTICGLSADPGRIAQLEREKVEIYPARAELRFAPLLEFSGLIRTNLARRLRATVGRRSERGGGRDGLVLVGYGSAEFDYEWTRFFTAIRAFAETELGIAASAHAWCGHIVRYRRQPIIDAIETVLRRAERVLVVPILVAYDPMFQERIIGRAVAACASPERVLYRPDAILPEPAVGHWVIEITRRMVGGEAAGQG